MRLKRWHCIAVLFIAVVAAYFFSLSAGFNSVDDLKRITWLDNAGSLNILHLFFPDGRNYYYRPLVTLTFFFDRDLWDSIASFIHLENILIHFGSVVLVFLLTRRVAVAYSASSLFPALWAALLFAWHPLATEAVCWVSGRYDLMACFFLLLAVWLLLIGLQGGRQFVVMLSGVALLMACLSKEVAVFALPGFLWLALFSGGRKPVLTAIRERYWALLAPIAAVAIYFLMRHAATARDTGVKTALKGVVSSGDYDLFDKARVALKVYGFYFKKLFFPWPLNFGITQISDYYVIAGLILCVGLLWLIWRRDLLSALALTAFCVLSPALLVVYGKMAWSPIAERYLYTSIALSAAPLTLWVTGFFERLTFAKRRPYLVGLFALLVLFYGTTAQRAWIWQDNIRLYRDTAEKSPDFLPAKTELASALLRRGEEAEAQKILTGMNASGSVPDYINDDLNLAVSYLNGGKPGEARDVLLPLLNKNPKKRFEVLQFLIRTNGQLLSRSPDPQQKELLQQEIVDWLLEEQRIRPRTFTLYRIGKAYLALGEKIEALKYFQRAKVKAPKGSHYYGALNSFIDRLQKENPSHVE